jgi:hypothetical protein
MKPLLSRLDTGKPGRTGPGVEFFPEAMLGRVLAGPGSSWRPQARSLATAPDGGRAPRAVLLARNLDIPAPPKRESDFGARFGLSDPRARRSTVAPLVMAQASARLPQSCGG